MAQHSTYVLSSVIKDSVQVTCCPLESEPSVYVEFGDITATLRSSLQDSLIVLYTIFEISPSRPCGPQDLMFVLFQI